MLWIKINIFIFHKTNFNVYNNKQFGDFASIPHHIEFFIMLVSFFVLMITVKIYNVLKNKDKKIFQWVLYAYTSFFIFSLVAILEYFFSDGTIYVLIGHILSYIFYMAWIILSLIFFYTIFKKYIIIKRSSLITLCMLILSSLSLIIYIGLSIQWGRPITHAPGLGHAFLIVFITVLYDLVIVCLINTKDRAVQIILIGIMILIAASLWVMCSFIQNGNHSEIIVSFHYKSLMFNLWAFGDLYGVFGLIIMLLGCSLLYYDKDLMIDYWFRETDSIISRLVTLIFSISMLTFVLFFVFIYSFSIIDRSFFPASPFFIIVYSIIVIIPSVFIGQYFESPFKKIANNIEISLDENNHAIMDDSFSISEFVFLQRFIMSSLDTVKEKINIEKQLVDLASQVAHDIRSPLTALDMILLDLPEINEEKRIIVRNANARIRDIANNLLSKNNPLKKINQAIEPWLLVDIIETCLSEKRFQLIHNTNIQLEFQYTQTSYDMFSKIRPSEFGSIISNLLNNAIEALKKEGCIMLTLFKENEQAIVTIQDNGTGMPTEILKKLGTPGMTYGKNNGHGLGVSHAISSITAWGGHIHFTSSLGEGTVVTLQLPLCRPPSWFLKQIIISDNMDILILDDDASIHHVWNRRFDSLNLAHKNCTWYHFYNATELESWLKNNKSNRKKLLLCDYEIIGSNKSGLDIIEALGLIQDAILVTSRYQDKYIVMRCACLEIPLLPKSLAIFVPILNVKYH